MPLVSFVKWTVQEAKRRHETHEGWTSDIFFFVWLLRGHPAIAEMQAPEAWAKVLQSMNMTTQLSFPFEELLNVDETAAENEFFDLWDRIRWRPGELPLDAALRQSQEKPLRLDARIAKKRPSGYPAFVSLAGWLQIVIGTTKPILLPVTGVADALGVTTACVSRYRRWAREDGYLLELRPSVKPKNGRPGYATEFRFDVNRFPVLLKQTGQGDIED